jgi:hypothetical protein
VPQPTAPRCAPSDNKRQTKPWMLESQPPLPGQWNKLHNVEYINFPLFWQIPSPINLLAHINNSSFHSALYTALTIV